MRILNFPIFQYFLKYLGLATNKRSYWKYEKIHLEKKRCIEELDCASNGIKLNYSDLARKYTLKDEKGALLFLLQKFLFLREF